MLKNSPSNDVFYPSLDTLVNVDGLPDGLDFIEGLTSDVIGGIFYRNLYITGNTNNDGSLYEMELITYNRMEVKLPAIGCSLVVNPSDADGTGSVFALHCSYSIGILRYIRQFSLSSFDWSGRAFFNLVTSIVNEGSDALFKGMISTFYDNAETLENNIKSFIDDYNTHHPDIAIEVQYDADAYIHNVVNAIESMGANINDIIFSDYVDDADINSLYEKIEKFGTYFLGFFTVDMLKPLLSMELNVELRDLSLGLEFPRSVLRPIDLATGEVYEDENIRSMLKFTAGSVRFSTRGGLEFEDESSFDFTESVIGNTGFTLKISDAKMDLSDRRNIAEAEAAGYPADFMGVYVGLAEIGLPAKWFRQEEGQTLGLYGERMLIGTGGFSGRIGLRAKGGGDAPEGAALTCRIGGENGFEIGFRSFGITLRQGMFGETDISGYIVVPQLKDAEGNAAGEWSFTAREEEGVRVTLFGVLNLDLRGFSVGQEEGRFYAALSCGLSLNDTGGKDVTAVLGGLGVEISELRVWQDGEVSLRTESGGVTLKEPVKVTVMGKAEFTVSALHMGSEERVRGGEKRQYMFLGLDCAIDTGTGGVDVKGNGLKFYFTTDGGEFDCFVKIEGISVDLTIPGDDPDKAAVLLRGYLTLDTSRQARRARA